MSIILCDANCDYQVEGICSLDKPGFVQKSADGCVYRVDSGNDKKNLDQANDRDSLR